MNSEHRQHACWPLANPTERKVFPNYKAAWSHCIGRHSYKTPWMIGTLDDDGRVIRTIEPVLPFPDVNE